MTKKAYPSDTQDRFIVRLPNGMRDKIAEEAKSNNRSMNAEIVARLEQSLQGSAESAAFTALAYRLATAEVDKESMRIDLQLLANRLRHIALMFELHVNGKHEAPSDEEFDVWKREASNYIEPRIDYLKSMQEKLDAARALAEQMHGVVPRDAA